MVLTGRHLSALASRLALRLTARLLCAAAAQV